MADYATCDNGRFGPPHAVAYKITTGSAAQFRPSVMLRPLTRAIAVSGHSIVVLLRDRYRMLVLRKAVIIGLATICLSGQALAQKETECFLLSSFTPSEDHASLSFDRMRAQILGQRSMQIPAYSALHDALAEDSISSSSISIQTDGVVAIQFNGACSAVLPTIRQHISALATELANTVTSAQLNEINRNWRQGSERDMPPSPIPVTH